MNGDWAEWSKHVLAELKRLDENQDKANDRLNKIDIKLAMLDVKAGIFGVVGGIVPVAIMFAMRFLNK